ncbi:MAG: alpha/beta hydrolase family esterase [Acidimicrobiia bacterium]
MRTSRRAIRRSLTGIAVIGLLAGSAIVIAAPPAQAASCSDLGPGQWDCTVDGRDVNIYVPDSYTGAEAVPLVVDMHGYTSSNSSQQTISGWDDLADVEGFIVAYPQGVSNSWNAQGLCCGSSSADDVQFIRDVVAHVRGAGSIDAGRIYATGLSNGGSMTHTLACEAPDLFAGASAVSYGLSGASTFQGIVDNCRSTLTEGIPVIHFHGTSDGIVDYEDGVLDSLGAEDSLEAWRQVQDASAASTTQNLSSNTSCSTHSDGRDGAPVSMCTVIGGSHVLYSDVAGAGIPSFSWDFFEDAAGDGGDDGDDGGGGAEAAFEENFEGGLGQFSATGNVYTGSYGVRMRGGFNDGEILSPLISTEGLTDITLTFDRNTDGTLDFGEWGYAEVSFDGGATFTVIERTRDATRSRVTFALGAEAANQPDLVLRFRIAATSFYEEYEVDDVLVEGTPV